MEPDHRSVEPVRFLSQPNRSLQAAQATGQLTPFVWIRVHPCSNVPVRTASAKDHENALGTRFGGPTRWT